MFEDEDIPNIVTLHNFEGVSEIITAPFTLPPPSPDLPSYVITPASPVIPPPSPVISPPSPVLPPPSNPQRPPLLPVKIRQRIRSQIRSKSVKQNGEPRKGFGGRPTKEEAERKVFTICLIFKTKKLV